MLAVDPARNRVYVLLVFERRERDEKEEKEEEKTGKTVFPLDMEMQAAGSLYEFEYKSARNSKLIGEADPRTAQGRARSSRRKRCSTRAGIAVDPATGDLAISGNQDEESNAKVRTGRRNNAAPRSSS